MPQNVEAERRALLSLDQRDDMLRYMRSRGRLVEFDRVMIDYSGEDRTRTVMIRVNDGRLELVAKSGKLADDVRAEADPQLALDTPLELALSYMAILGYKDAVVCRRRMHAVRTTEGLEYSLRDILSHETNELSSTMLEVEALGVMAGEEQSALSKIDEAFKLHKITPLTKEEWTEWVAKTHHHDDQVFNYTPQAASQLVHTLLGAGLVKV